MAKVVGKLTQGFVDSCSQSELLTSRPLLYRQQKKAGKKGDLVLQECGFHDPASNALDSGGNGLHFRPVFPATEERLPLKV